MKNIFILLIVLFFAACNNTSTNNSNSEGANPNGPVIYFYTEKIDLGTLKQGEVKEFSFKFKNTGKSELVINSVPPTCGCTNTQFDPKPIKPGAESEIRLTFNSANKMGIVNKSVSVNSNATKEPKILHFTCQIVSPNNSK